MQSRPRSTKSVTFRTGDVIEISKTRFEVEARPQKLALHRIPRDDRGPWLVAPNRLALLLACDAIRLQVRAPILVSASGGGQ